VAENLRGIRCNGCWYERWQARRPGEQYDLTSRDRPPQFEHDADCLVLLARACAEAAQHKAQGHE